MKNLKGTGRTTRMIEEAKQLAREGRAVYIVVANRSQANMLMTEEIHSLGIKIETAGDLGNFFWETMSLRGAHPNCVVLVDHYVIEHKFGRMLAMLHRYDAERSESK